MFSLCIDEMRVLAVESSLILNPRLLVLLAKRVGNLEEHEVGPKASFLVRETWRKDQTLILYHTIKRTRGREK